MDCGQLGCGALLLQLVAFGLSNGALIALNALGVTLVYSVVRTVNFAYGDLFALSTVLVTSVITSLGLTRSSPLGATAGGLLLALVASMLFGAGLNVGIERLAFRPFRGRSQLAPLVAGLGLSFILFQVALLWRTLQEVGLGQPEHHSNIDNLNSVAHGRIPELLPATNVVEALGLPLPVVYTLKDGLVLGLALALTLGVHLVLRRTRFGRMVRALAQDPEQARLCGANPDRGMQRVFALGGALAGAGAWVFALYYGRPFGFHGAQSGLIAFTAAVLGGIGNPLGALASGILLGILSALSDYFLPAQWTPVLVLATLIVLLVLRPTGLAAEGGAGLGDAATGSEVLAGRRERSGRRWFLGSLLLLALAYPLLDRLWNLHAMALATNLLVWALLALGLNIVMGFGGMLDLGFAACFAVGGYAAGLLLNSAQGRTLEFVVILAASIGLAALFGLLNGVLTLRLRGDYLAIVALAFGQMVPRIVVNLGKWTGGGSGLSALPPPRLGGYTLLAFTGRYYLALLLVALVVGASFRLARSRLGRAWAALRDDEAAALSCGINLARVKPLAFMLGAAVAGIAAALAASVFGYVDPDQSDFRVSALVLAMVVVGGAGNVGGVLGGAVVIVGYDRVVLPALRVWWDRMAQNYDSPWLTVLNPGSLSYLCFGLALYLTVRWRGRRRRATGQTQFRVWSRKLFTASLRKS